MYKYLGKRALDVTYHRMPIIRMYMAPIIRVFRCVVFGSSKDFVSLA